LTGIARDMSMRRMMKHDGDHNLDVDGWGVFVGGLVCRSSNADAEVQWSEAGT
jgi:hypothetical protein